MIERVSSRPLSALERRRGKRIAHGDPRRSVEELRQGAWSRSPWIGRPCPSPSLSKIVFDYLLSSNPSMPWPAPTLAPAAPRHRLTTDERQREIVATVLALARERGPDAITTQAIADRMGVTQGAAVPALPRQTGDLARGLCLGARIARRGNRGGGGEGGLAAGQDRAGVPCPCGLHRGEPRAFHASCSTRCSTRETRRCAPRCAR